MLRRRKVSTFLGNRHKASKKSANLLYGNARAEQTTRSIFCAFLLFTSSYSRLKLPIATLTSSRSPHCAHPKMAHFSKVKPIWWKIASKLKKKVISLAHAENDFSFRFFGNERARAPMEMRNKICNRTGKIRRNVKHTYAHTSAGIDGKSFLTFENSQPNE